MAVSKKYNEEDVERLIAKRLAKRHAKKRRRMPVHGAGFKKVGELWTKRLKKR